MYGVKVLPNFEVWNTNDEWRQQIIPKQTASSFVFMFASFFPTSAYINIWWSLERIVANYIGLFSFTLYSLVWYRQVKSSTVSKKRALRLPIHKFSPMPIFISTPNKMREFKNQRENYYFYFTEKEKIGRKKKLGKKCMKEKQSTTTWVIKRKIFHWISLFLTILINWIIKKSREKKEYI